MRIGENRYRCARCGQEKPLTDEHFSFARTGPRAGRVTGYCRPCQRAWRRDNWAAATEYERLRHRRSARFSKRRADGISPDRYHHRYRHEAPP